MLADRIAYRYATALYQLAVERNSLNQVMEDFKSIEKIYQESSDFRVLLRSPVITHEQKVPILKKILEGKATPVVSKFIIILTKRSREALLPNVIHEFQAIYNANHQITDAELVTAHLFEPAQKHEIVQKLESLLKTKVNLSERVDTDLIGGFQIRIGSSLIDASIQNTLRLVRKKLNNN